MSRGCDPRDWDPRVGIEPLDSSGSFPPMPGRLTDHEMKRLLLQVLRDHWTQSADPVAERFQVDNLMLVGDRRIGFQINRNQSHRVFKQLVKENLATSERTEIGPVACITPAGLDWCRRDDRVQFVKRLVLATVALVVLSVLAFALFNRIRSGD